METTYLGDGVYVRFTGYSWILEANDHMNPTDVIELDQETWVALQAFVKKTLAMKNTLSTPEWGRLEEFQ